MHVAVEQCVIVSASDKNLRKIPDTNGSMTGTARGVRERVLLSPSSIDYFPIRQEILIWTMLSWSGISLSAASPFFSSSCTPSSLYHSDASDRRVHSTNERGSCGEIYRRSQSTWQSRDFQIRRVDDHFHASLVRPHSFEFHLHPP